MGSRAERDRDKSRFELSWLCWRGFLRVGSTDHAELSHFVGALLRPATLTTRGRLSASGALCALVGLAKRAVRFTPALIVGHGVRTTTL